MRLARFYEEIGPYLLGQRDHDETVRRLYGPDAAGPDPERLRIYGRFCRIHRHEVLELMFLHCRAALSRHFGAAAWDRLVPRYFAAHPMHHFELNQNGIHFPAFLAGLVEAGELPAYYAELADFEWWEWLTDTALDDPADATPDEGSLRLHSAVELRPYTHDLVGWIDDDNCEAAAPPRRDIVVLFYRDRELRPRRERAAGLSMLIIKAVVESVPLDRALAARLEISPKKLSAAVKGLQKSGILLGKAPPSRAG